MKKLSIFISTVLVLAGCNQPNVPTMTSQEAIDRGLEIQAIKDFRPPNHPNEGYQSVNFLRNEPNPNTDAMDLKFEADGDTYLMYGTHIEEFNAKNINGEEPMGPKTYSKKELEKMALNVFYNKGTNVDALQLKMSFSQKEHNYFFTWEGTKEMEGRVIDTKPFIQVGIRNDGWIFSYLNTFGF